MSVQPLYFVCSAGNETRTLVHTRKRSAPSSES